MKAIIGKKLGMTRIFDEQGKSFGVTLIQATENTVTAIISKEKSGYSAVQIGYGKAKKLSKPVKGHLKDEMCSYLKEFTGTTENKVGDKINVSLFNINDTVNVTSTSKGKGFAGVIKRHSFSRGPETHGSKHHRAHGSIGCRFPQRTIKGKRMAGHMGFERVTVKNLKIVDIDKDNNLLALAGAVPGAKGAIVEIKGI